MLPLTAIPPGTTPPFFCKQIQVDGKTVSIVDSTGSVATVEGADVMVNGGKGGELVWGAGCRACAAWGSSLWSCAARG